MKKTYINPNIEVVMMATRQQNMLVTSDPNSGVLFDPTAETGTMDAREFTFDEEEFELEEDFESYE